MGTSAPPESTEDVGPGFPTQPAQGSIEALLVPRCARGVGAALRDPPTLLAIGLTLYAVVYLAYIGTAPAASLIRQAILLLAFLPMNAGIVALAWIAAHRLSGDGMAGLRRALALTGVGFLGVLAGNVGRFLYVHALHQDPDNAWVNLPYLMLYAAWLVALLALPRARRLHAERRKFLYDAATILLGIGIAVWYIVVVPTALSGKTGWWAQFFDVAFPAGDAAVALGLTTVWLRPPPGRRRAPFMLLLAGMTMCIASDLANQLVEQRVGYAGIQWTDVTFMIAYLLLAWACQRYAWLPPARSADPPSLGRTKVQPFSPLPYLALLTCYALLIREAINRPTEHWATLAEGSILVTLLVVLRQLTAVRENAHLVAETAARENEARFRALVQHSSDIIAIADQWGVLRFVSPSVTRLFGYRPDELEGTSLVSLLHPADTARGAAALTASTPLGSVTPPSEWRIQHRDGRWVSVEAVGTNLLHEPVVKGIVLNARDISERKALEAQLTHQAFHDPLTGLANRALFFDRVTHALERRTRSNERLAVLFLDLDNFKTVNDSLGHVPGDRLLVAAAVRLAACVRTADTVARLGGDEFAILIEDARDDLALRAAERITTALQEPFTVEGKELFVSASLGIATDEPGMTASELLRNADMAMYTAKSRGKGRSEQFEHRMHREALDRLELEGDLRRAVERRDFLLLYQPIVNLETSAVTGMEALLRWVHPRRGTLYPSQFIPLAEETGLIVPLGEWVLQEACRQAKEWDNQWKPAEPLAISVNVSGQQLQHLGIVAAVKTALDRAELRPSCLVLEITESVLMQHTETMLERLTQLKGVGIQLAIDDFGTGYSSLSYLQRFPIDILKIAKPFVDDIGRVGAGGPPVLARAIIALGETLALRTIAEGIEVREQWQGLRALGCELGQGYYFARPLTAESMSTLIAHGARTARELARR